MTFGLAGLAATARRENRPHRPLPATVWGAEIDFVTQGDQRAACAWRAGLGCAVWWWTWDGNLTDDLKGGVGVCKPLQALPRHIHTVQCMYMAAR
jgi:hypothetical protein